MLILKLLRRLIKVIKENNMGFQDNSGDIILDVVLTDEGRKKLAAGNFNITKFALGDDEINYELFNVGASTALQDLSILQTPILEAFTNNTASMKSKLLYGIGTGTAGMLSIWYLPTLLLNTLKTNTKTSTAATGAFIVTADSNTYTNSSNTGIGKSSGNALQGVQNGASTSGGANSDGQIIRVDAGYNTGDTNAVDTSIAESSYTITMDDRLLKLRDVGGSTLGYSDLDDDGFAVYNSVAVTFPAGQLVTQGTETPITTGGWLSGWVAFKLGANTSNLVSDYLFTKMGNTGTMTGEGGGTSNIRYIDTTVRITGNTLGASIDIPVRVVKLQ